LFNYQWGGGGGGGGGFPLSPVVPLLALTVIVVPLSLQFVCCAGQAKASHNAKNMFSIFQKIKG
jgi:hypothetical protein